jgi:hypothetical protein
MSLSYREAAHVPLSYLYFYFRDIAKEQRPSAAREINRDAFRTKLAGHKLL